MQTHVIRVIPSGEDGMFFACDEDNNALVESRTPINHAAFWLLSRRFARADDIVAAYAGGVLLCVGKVLWLAAMTSDEDFRTDTYPPREEQAP